MAQYAENPTTFSSDFPEITLISYPNANNDSQISFSNTNETMANTSIVINEQQIKKSRICHPVWQYLSRNVDNTSIICNLCQQKYSSKTGISTIKEHFMTNHKDEWTMIEQQQTNKSVEPYAITTDNASNMNVFGQNFTQLLSDNHGNVLSRRVRCAAHILNLVVRDGLDAVGKSIIKARKFAIAIRSSQVLFEELKKIFELKQRPFLVPEIDVSTRWNSTYIMIEKLRKIRELTDILVASNPLLKDISPNDEDWKELDSLVTLLEPVYQATNLLSASNHPTFEDLCTVFLVI
ncbi:16027_t:CDS:2, partial [Rhizophagus irregularis]